MGLDNINEVSAMADRLSIPQLQQAMRDGTLPAYVGLPILQQKVKLQKQMQSAMMVQQPKAPTVAQQVESEAPQYADGGIIAFAGKNGSLVRPPETMEEQLNRLRAKQALETPRLTPEELEWYNRNTGWTPEAIEGYGSPGEVRVNPTEPRSFSDILKGRPTVTSPAPSGIEATLPQQTISEMAPSARGEYLNRMAAQEKADVRSNLAREEYRARPRGEAGETTFRNAGQTREELLRAAKAKEDLALGRAGNTAALESELAAEAANAPKISAGAAVDPWTGSTIPTESKMLRGVKNIGSTLGKAAEAISLPTSILSAQSAFGIDPRVLMAAAGNEEAKQAIASGEARLPSAIESLLAHPVSDTYGYLKEKLKGAPQAEAQPTPVQAAPVQQTQAPAQPTVAAPAQPQTQPTVAEVNRVGAHRLMGAEAAKQGRAMAGTGGPANFLNPAAVEQIAAQTQAQTQAPTEQEAPVTVASAAKEYKDYLGEDEGVKRMQKQLDQMRADKEAGKDSSLWNALMMGGLQYAGGANLGQAGTAGLNVWTEGQKEARKQEEKLYGLQNDLEKALRDADVKAADYGFKSKEAYDARKHAEKLQAQKDAADYKRAMDIAKINAETQKEVMQGYAGAKVAAAEARGAGGVSQYKTEKDAKADYERVSKAIAKSPEFTSFNMQRLAEKNPTEYNRLLHAATLNHIQTRDSRGANGNPIVDGVGGVGNKTTASGKNYKILSQ